MPSFAIPTLAQVLAAGNDAGGKSITNLAGVNGINFTHGGSVMEFPSDASGAIWMHGGTIAMNVSNIPGSGGGSIVMESGIIYGVGGMNINTPPFPIASGAAGVIFNSGGVLNVS